METNTIKKIRNGSFVYKNMNGETTQQKVNLEPEPTTSKINKFAVVEEDLHMEEDLVSDLAMLLAEKENLTLQLKQTNKSFLTNTTRIQKLEDEVIDLRAMVLKLSNVIIQVYKPTHEVPKNLVPEVVKTENLFKRFRDILNILTPETFQTALEKINNLNIDTAERLKGIIDLVHEKAVDEWSSSIVFANLCKCLAMMKIPLGNNKNEYVNFRKLLLNKCQKEFEKNINYEVDKAKRVKGLQLAGTDEYEKELQDFERKIKRRSLGNIRFIGELFKLYMLTASIMFDCLKQLLSLKDEHSLKCLYYLLITIGKDLESEKVKRSNPKDAEDRMNLFFRTIEEDITNRQTSSRIRLMLQNVIELRHNNWVPQRDENSAMSLGHYLEAHQSSNENQNFNGEDDIQLGTERHVVGCRLL